MQEEVRGLMLIKNKRGLIKPRAVFDDDFKDLLPEFTVGMFRFRSAPTAHSCYSLVSLTQRETST